jgi:hypothetical protein
MNSENFTNLLDKLAILWHQQQVPIIDQFNPGVDISPAQIGNFSGELPNEVFKLYEWRNGQNIGSASTLLGELWFFNSGIFLPFETLIMVQNQMGNNEYGWNSTMLPLFESGGGDYYLIECDKFSHLYGMISFYCPSAVDFDKIITMYDSLETFFSGIYESFEKGVYRYDEMGVLQSDQAQLSDIEKRLNPKSDYWKLF